MRAVLVAIWLVGCSFGANPPAEHDAPPLPGPPDADPRAPDAPPVIPDARLPDAAPATPDAAPDARVALCGPGYAPIANGYPAGTTYRGVSTRTAWQTAETDCEAAGAALVVVDNAAEAAAVAGLVVDPGTDFDSPYFWTGVYDEGGNHWATVRGAAPTYLPWGTDEPDGGSQNCVLFGDFTGNPAYDYYCSAGQVYVCECLLP